MWKTRKSRKLSVSRRITHSYLLALSLIAIFSLGGHFSIRSVIGTHDRGIEVSQDIARQQMLTQRVALLSLDLVSRTSDLERNELRKALSESISEMELIQQSLLSVEGEWRLLTSYARMEGGAYLNPPMDLEARLQVFLDRAKRVLSKSEKPLSSNDQDVKFLVSVGSASLLESIDHAVQHYHHITQSRLKSIVLLETMLFLATIFVLVVEAVFIFRPLVRLVRAKIIELKRAEKELNAVIDTTGGGILICNTHGVIQRVNESVNTLFNVDENELIGRPFLDLVIQERDLPWSSLESFLTNDWVEIGVHFNEGPVIPVLVNVTATELFHTRLFTIALLDIRERKQHEKELKQALYQKSLLLQEIHHRVKNNLQVVSSFLNLQSRNIQDETIRTQLEESRNRVDAMALIHEELYKSSDLSTIAFDRYIEDLIRHLFRSSGVQESRLSLHIDIQDALFDIDTAVPCGLIVNELVSNCLEHAYPIDSIGGKILIQSYADSDGYTHLIVEDNGVGLPDGFDVHTSNSMGLRIVNALVSQLKGSLTVKGKGGAHFHIVFSRHAESDEQQEAPKSAIT